MMMTVARLLLVALVGQALPADHMAAALAEGTRTKKGLSVTAGAAAVKFSPYQVIVTGPYGRVQTLAADAAHKLQPVPPVPPELLAPVLSVRIIPMQPTTPTGIPLPATHVVMRYKGSTESIQPLTLTPQPYEWSNVLGGRAVSQGLEATFPLPSRPGDLEFVVVNETRQLVHTVKAKDRSKLR
jgi:hypothetical protein